MESESGSAGGSREVRGYRITGRVQGVGFRWWTQDAGRALGLAGSVWNRRDGSVEVCAAGKGTALDALERALGEGPLGARVDSVTRVRPDHEPVGEGFRIVHP
ncbi:MAG: acylphosphatase [Gemmatimonadetes bacterium]|nr:acylphosphatase [Gemmatimonadota bacterium]